MRLRQLGSTQSVTFFPPKSTRASWMCARTDMGRSSTPPTSLAGFWSRPAALMSSCGITSYQGTDFCHESMHNGRVRISLLTKVTETRISKLFDIRNGKLLSSCTEGGQILSLTLDNLSSAELRGFMEELNERRRAANSYGQVIQSSVLEEVEQEREVEFQVEEVRQVQKPRHYKALTFRVCTSPSLTLSKLATLLAEMGTNTRLRLWRARRLVKTQCLPQQVAAICLRRVHADYRIEEG
jgi:hypothetical protein